MKPIKKMLKLKPKEKFQEELQSILLGLLLRKVRPRPVEQLVSKLNPTETLQMRLPQMLNQM